MAQVIEYDIQLMNEGSKRACGGSTLRGCIKTSNDTLRQ